MAHPGDERLARVEAPKQRARATAYLHLRASILAAICRRHFATVQVGDEVHAIANAEHRGDVERRLLGGGYVLAVNRIRSATKDDSGRRPLTNPVDGARRWMNLRIDTGFANASCDELRVLRAIVDDQNS